jgi:hypothetical protein
MILRHLVYGVAGAPRAIDPLLTMRAETVATGCHRLRPLGSISAASCAQSSEVRHSGRVSEPASRAGCGEASEVARVREDSERGEASDAREDRGCDEAWEIPEAGCGPARTPVPAAIVEEIAMPMVPPIS